MTFITDTHKLKDKITLNQNGYAVFENVKIAKANNIQQYANYEFEELPEHLQDKEIINVYRPFKEVKKSVKNFSVLPITDEHPSEDVNPFNYLDHYIGFATEAIFENNHVVSSSIIITDADMIALLQSKDSYQLSCGYSAEIVFEAGTTKSGEPYDAYMRNLEGNHVAIVSRGKCGSTCKL